MNIYQQNTNNVRITTVTIVQVTFNNIVVDSSINNLLNKLKVAFGELNRQINLKIPVNEIKSKGIEINSTVDTLINSTNEIDFNERNSFIKSLIESSVVIIGKYEDAANIDGFGDELRNELVDYCHTCYKNHFARYLDANFWWELKLYEWLKKENFIEEPQYGLLSALESYKRYFSDDELEKFFSENRTDIIRKIINCEKSHNSKLVIKNPLSQDGYKSYFDIFKLLPSKAM